MKESGIQNIFTKQKDGRLYSVQKLQAEVRKRSRTIRRQDWDKFVKTLEHDITGEHRIQFKIFKKLQMDEKDKPQVNLIHKETWIEHYLSLWMTERNREESIDRMETELPGKTQKRQIYTKQAQKN
jgi:hypothetical protein